jgi:hypothetical protein
MIHKTKETIPFPLVVLTETRPETKEEKGRSPA